MRSKRARREGCPEQLETVIWSPSWSRRLKASSRFQRQRRHVRSSASAISLLEVLKEWVGDQTVQQPEQGTKPGRLALVDPLLTSPAASVFLDAAWNYAKIPLPGHGSS